MYVVGEGMVIKVGFTGSAESPRRHEIELEHNFQRLHYFGRICSRRTNMLGGRESQRGAQAGK
jgi:hypothetical protein